jgi:predicted PurR-regulated permease PerM
MSNPSFTSRDLPRTTLGVLFLAAMIVSTVWVLRPFLSAVLWATMVVIATWPLMLRIQAALGGSRGLATTVMTVALLLVLVIPLTVAISTLVAHMDDFAGRADSLSRLTVPPPPKWVASIPLQGQKWAEEWERAAAEGPGALTPRIKPYLGGAVHWLAGTIGGLGSVIVQFLITVIISAVLYQNGETAAQGVRRFATRLAGAQGDRAAVLAANTIRGVAMGVIVTAVFQTTVAGTGLILTAVPAATVLTAVILILCIAQLGPILIMVPATIWKFYSGDTFWAVVLLVFALVSCTMDNVIRPILIRKGADLPILLILAGVIGGMIGFGVMGIFVGPVILAVTYVLVGDWVASQPAPIEETSAATTV